MTGFPNSSQRLQLAQRLSSLPGSQLDQVIFALNPPKGNIPPASAPPADRVMALLTWAESAIGCGLEKVEEVISSVLARPDDSAPANDKNRNTAYILIVSILLILTLLTGGLGFTYLTNGKINASFEKEYIDCSKAIESKDYSLADATCRDLYDKCLASVQEIKGCTEIVANFPKLLKEIDFLQRVENDQYLNLMTN